MYPRTEIRRVILMSTLAAFAITAGLVPAGIARAQDSGYKHDLLASIEDARGKLIDLADATPVAKYAWRPGKGVRSTGEVFLHVAQANYLIPTLLGVAVPEGVEAMKIEKSAADKAKTIELLKASFDHAEEAIRNTSDADLDKTVKIFDHDGTMRDVEMIILSHAHEHLGQSIAYARMNGIVPPWTAREQAEAAKAKDKTKGM
ncbi:MAG: DinB family protein [Candidatus Eisenbacteria bacterium]